MGDISQCCPWWHGCERGSHQACTNGDQAHGGWGWILYSRLRKRNLGAHRSDLQPVQSKSQLLSPAWKWLLGNLGSLGGTENLDDPLSLFPTLHPPDPSPSPGAFPCVQHALPLCVIRAPHQAPDLLACSVVFGHGRPPPRGPW